MQNTQVIVSKKYRNIRSVADMNGKVLGAQIGSSGYLDFEAQPELLKNYLKNNYADQYQSFNESLIDPLLIDRVYANYYLASEGIINDYEIFPAEFEIEAFVVGVSKSNQTLQEQLNQAFVALYQEEKFQEISQKWYGKNIATTEIKGER